ncbi:MAG: hypothetical protein J0G32_07530, partial [Alphaproteobacteria bacterium]|nr:hypothetical protein [Alphaproteobacteria bacterium]
MSKSNFSSFAKDKQDLIDSINNYTKKNFELSEPNWNIEIAEKISTLQNMLENENIDYTRFIENLEVLHDLKQHIKQTLDSDRNMLIRDARFAIPYDSKTGDISSYIENFANHTEAAKEILRIENRLTPDLEKELDSEFKNFARQMLLNQEGKKLSELDLREISDSKLLILTDKLAEYGVENIHPKMAAARDFQNFNHRQYNFATITKVEGNLYVEAETGLRQMTDEQKKLYENRKNETWYKANPPFTQSLIDLYTDKLTSGQFVLPTQLRGLVGVRNAAETMVANIDAAGSMKILTTSKHTGGVATNLKDKKAQEQITPSNIRQVKEWVGTNKKLHINSLNSPNNVFNKFDRMLVAQTKKETKEMGIAYTNTAFNVMRKIPNASFVSGIDQVFDNFSQKLSEKFGSNPDNQEHLDTINNHLQAKLSFFQILLSVIAAPFFMGDKVRNYFHGKNTEKALAASTKLGANPDELKAIQDMIIAGKRSHNLRGSFLNAALSSRNHSLDTSTALSTALHSCNQVGLTDYDSIKFCASGKDRTGLALHNDAARSIQQNLKSKGKSNIHVDEIDTQLLKGGHQAHKPGSALFGGGTISAFGTKAENYAGMPKKRANALNPIVQISSKNNSVKYKAD